MALPIKLRSTLRSLSRMRKMPQSRFIPLFTFMSVLIIFAQVVVGEPVPREVRDENVDEARPRPSPTAPATFFTLSTCHLMTPPPPPPPPVATSTVQSTSMEVSDVSTPTSFNNSNNKSAIGPATTGHSTDENVAEDKLTPSTICSGSISNRVSPSLAQICATLVDVAKYLCDVANVTTINVSNNNSCPSVAQLNSLGHHTKTAAIDLAWMLKNSTTSSGRPPSHAAPNNYARPTPGPPITDCSWEPCRLSAEHLGVCNAVLAGLHIILSSNETVLSGPHAASAKEPTLPATNVQIPHSQAKQLNKVTRPAVTEKSNVTSLLKDSMAKASTTTTTRPPANGKITTVVVGSPTTIKPVGQFITSNNVANSTINSRKPDAPSNSNSTAPSAGHLHPIDVSSSAGEKFIPVTSATVTSTVTPGTIKTSPIIVKVTRQQASIMPENLTTTTHLPTTTTKMVTPGKLMPGVGGGLPSPPNETTTTLTKKPTTVDVSSTLKGEDKMEPPAAPAPLPIDDANEQGTGVGGGDDGDLQPIDDEQEPPTAVQAPGSKHADNKDNEDYHEDDDDAAAAEQEGEEHKQELDIQGAIDVDFGDRPDARPKGHAIGTFSSGYSDDADSHFFIYFLSVVVMCIAMYLLFHNKQKILAIIVEGRQDRRRRPNSNLYRKLDNNLEEVLMDRPKNGRSNIIY